MHTHGHWAHRTRGTRRRQAEAARHLHLLWLAIATTVGCWAVDCGQPRARPGTAARVVRGRVPVHGVPDEGGADMARNVTTVADAGPPSRSHRTDRDDCDDLQDTDPRGRGCTC
jgi:hypothetical protein